MVSRSLPMPSIRAPMAFRQRARSPISGSRAALASTVRPSASAAAISRFSVAPTETNGNTMVAPRSRPLTVAVDVAAVEPERRAHLLQALEVQVDRPGADRAAARQRDARLARAGQQRAEHQDRGAHLAHDVVGRLGAGDRAAERQRAAVVADRIDGDAVLGQQQAHGLDVGKPRHVAEHQALVGQQGGGHQRQGGVLGAADDDLAGERPAAADADAVHQDEVAKVPDVRQLYILGNATPRWRMYLPALSA